MPTKPLPDEVLAEAVDTLEAYNGNKTAAARHLEIDRATLSNRIMRAQERGIAGLPPTDIKLPDLPASDIPIEELIDQQCKRYEMLEASYKAHTWFDVTVKEDKPLGVLWVGDPHVDDPACDWPRLRRHVELCNRPGIVAVNIGDSSNNWVGRLMSKYADQSVSVSDAHRLIEWLMFNLEWAAFLLGNHDDWHQGQALIKQMAKRAPQKVICHNWEARFKLAFPSGWAPRIYSAHDFKGSSIWNEMHGPLRESMIGEEAEIFVCGHKHTFGIMDLENPKRHIRQQLIRVRGYKSGMVDGSQYSRRGQWGYQDAGCSVLTIFDPSDKSITSFEDIAKGVQFLEMLRDG